MEEAGPATEAAPEGLNTDPKTVVVGLLASVQNAILPTLAITFGTGGIGTFVALPVALAIIVIGTVWRG